MANIPSAISKMQVEESDSKSIRSERYFQKLGANINALLETAVFDIGEVVISILNETQFQSQNGTNWVECDGQSIEPSELSSLTGLAFAPNLMGRFTKQVNLTEIGVDANRSLNTTQSDGNKSHNHFFLASSVVGGAPNFITPTANVVVSVGPVQVVTTTMNSSTQVPNVESSDTNGQVSTAGIAEFRPSNIAFHYFIKINN